MNRSFFKNALFATFLILTNILNINATQGNDKVLLASDFINPADEDVAPGLHRLFETARKGHYTRIKFRKGIYHIYSDHAFEKYCFISNHDSGLRKIAFAIMGFNQLEIDGGGAEFIIHGLVIPILVEDSKNITIRNLSFNHFRATHSELTVASVNSDSVTIDFKIGKEYPYEIRNGELVFLKHGYEHNLENAIYWDPAKNAVAFQSRAMTPLYKTMRKAVTYSVDDEKQLHPVDSNSPPYKFRGIENSLMARQLEPGLVRISGVKNNLPRPGWILVAKGLNGNNRLAPGVRLLDSENILINNVTVHHASGMGLIAEGCTNITLDAFNVLPKPGGGRILSTNADASHFVGCRGKILLKNCRFENQLDDATNIHGTYMEVTNVGENAVGARVGHFQQVGFHFARPGDSVVAVNPAVSARPLAKMTVKKVEMINARFFQVIFNEKVPDAVKKGYYLENVQAYPEVEIRDNQFINNRARGLLISTPRKVVIENNVISSMMAGIQCPNEFTFWYESGYVKDITIRNNKFLDNTYGNPKPSPVINIMAASASHDPVHKKFVIENNQFVNYSSFILGAEYVENLVFRYNTITYSGNYPLDGASPIIHLTGVGTANLENNRYDSRFNHFLSGDSGNRGKITNVNNEAVSNIRN